MSKARMVVVGIAVVVGIVSKVFFVDKKDAGSFNDRLVDAAQKADSRFTQFTSMMKSYDEGKKVDVASMNRSRDSLDQQFRADLEEVKKMKVPDDQNCRDFHGAVYSYLEHSTRFLDKYKEVIQYVSAHNPGAPADVMAVELMLAELAKKDEELFDKVKTSQVKMAKSFGLKLK